MTLVDFLFVFAFGHMSVAMLLLVPHWRTSQSLRLYLVFMLCSSCHVLGNIFDTRESANFFYWVFYIGNNALPGVFWLMAISIFGQHVVLKPWHFGVASLTLLVPTFVTFIQLAFSFDLRDYEGLYGLSTYGTMALELTFVVHALVTISRHWDDDLVQERRYMRAGVIGVAALYIFLVIIIEQLLALRWSWLELVESIILVLIVTAFNLFLFKMCDNSLFVASEVAPIEPIKMSPNSKELSAIINAMESDNMYQQEGLTIAIFAKHLAIHEYKLRALINGELAFRNFNDFLNHYRISEVTQKLEIKAEKQLPVLTLALESGFRSLSSFNKAFKEKHGITPTEYRKRAASES